MLHDVTAILVHEHPEIFDIQQWKVTQSYPGVIGIYPTWIEAPEPTVESNVVMDVKDPEKYWELIVDYLSKYN